MADKEQSSEGKGSRGRKKGCLGSIGVLAVLLAICLVAACIAVRTERGRSFVQDKLRKATGTEVSIEKAKIGFPFALVLEKVVLGEAGTEGKPWFRAQEVRVQPGVDCSLRVSVAKCELDLVEGGSEGWQPAYFKRLGDLPAKGVAGITKLTQGIRTNYWLSISEGYVRWLAEDGTETAAMSGLTYRLEPTEVTGRKMYYSRISVYSMTDGEGRRTRDVEREWLSIDGRDYIEIAGAGGATQGEGKGFWETTE